MPFQEYYWWWFLGISIPLTLAVWVVGNAIRYRTTGNPFGTLLCGFLSTTLVWLAILGVQALSFGYRIPLASYKVALPLAILLLIVIFHGFQWNWRHIGIALSGLAVCLVLAAMAALGLSIIHWGYIRRYAYTWLLISLGSSLGFQVLFYWIRRRAQRTQIESGEGGEGEDGLEEQLRRLVGK